MPDDMKVTISIYPAPLNPPVSMEAGNESGAFIEFKGFVREKEGEARLSGIRYEAFEDMARHQFLIICQEIEKQWPVQEIQVHHVTGEVKVGHPSIWAAVTSSHRKEGFLAIQYLLTEMKKRVPIWKHPLTQ